MINDRQNGFFLVKASAPDNEDPVAVCQNFTASLDENGEVVVSGDDVDGGSSDNSGFVTLTLSENTFDCTDLGPNTVTVTATDPSGNTDTCTAVITVVDDMGPIFDCYQNQTVAYDTGSSFYTLIDFVASGDVTASDNCTASLAIAQTPAAGAELTEGVYTISFETTDDEGNTSNCSFELTVEEILSIQNATLSEGLSIYPNPASNNINVVSKNENLTRIIVADITGKILMSLEQLDVEKQSVDVSNLSEGIYFVNINNSITKKIIKK
jgi:hypothetical protein